MDVLSDLLHRAGLHNPNVRKSVLRPPWSVGFAESPALAVLATVRGGAWITRGDTGASCPVAEGDIALVRGDVAHTVGDDPATPPQLLVRAGAKEAVGRPDEVARAVHEIAPRTYGDGTDDATVFLRGSFDLRGAVADRLLELLPPVAVVPAGPRTRAALNLLADEVSRDEPGQDAVLHRLLDLVLVLALRAWGAGPDGPPAWWRAWSDPAVGTALRLLHETPEERWTVAGLALQAGLSRAAFAARFTALVGRPPLTYLTEWRMTLAADRLREPRATVASVARAVGYEDPFAFSEAFKRVRGVSPSAWRRSGAELVPEGYDQVPSPV